MTNHSVRKISSDPQWKPLGRGRGRGQTFASWSLYESLPADNVLESAALDKGYAADRIRERLACDGIEPVIPPLSSRSKKPSYDKALYRERNRVERFFNKLKQFRRLATRYDKLAKTFFAAVYLVSAFLIIRHS